MNKLPDKRLRRVVEDILLGILGGQTPVVTAMARQNRTTKGETWAAAKRIYRLLRNKRVETESLYQGLYQIGQEVMAAEDPEYLVVAVDPVNLEKPYTKKLEGVSTVHKATPPGGPGPPPHNR